MGGFVERWRARPPLWNAADALADPQAWCSLSPWLPVDQLRRGFQFGQAEVNRAWCIGLYQLPHEVSRSLGADPLRRGASPWLFILPEVLRELCAAAGEPKVSELVLRMARVDLAIPSHVKVLHTPIAIPGDGGRQSPLYLFRGEVAFLAQPAPPVALALGQLARASLAGWYSMNPPAELIPRPWYGLPDANRPKRKPYGSRATRMLEKYRRELEAAQHPERVEVRRRRYAEAIRAEAAQQSLL